MTYKEQLESPLWQKKRLKIFERDGFSCQLCSDLKTQLHVHHKSYSGKAWDAPESELLTVCKYCHSAIEYLKKENKSLIIYHVTKAFIEWKSATHLTCCCKNNDNDCNELVTITFQEDKIVEGLYICKESLDKIFKNLEMTPDGK